MTGSTLRKSGATDIVDVYHIELTYDFKSNVIIICDHVHNRFSAAFTMDNLDRLIDAEYGTWDTQSGGIDTTAVQQVSGGTGLDGDGAGSYIDAVILRDRDANTGGESGGSAAETDACPPSVHERVWQGNVNAGEGVDCP